MKKEFWILLLFQTFGLFSYQQELNFQNLIQVGTVSPEAASIGKFGNVPVSYCTGVPSISIPVYEIKIANTRIPISLDYHAGGIRVDETSSSVGLGWALSGIGTVSRNVIGLPDDLTGGYIGSPDPITVINSPGTYQNYLYQVKNRAADAEPDIFQYSAPGISGKFILRRDGSTMQIPESNNKISFSGQGFIIVNDVGTKYYFEEKRHTYSSESSYPVNISTWCLTKIIDPNGVDEITFSYESSQYYSYDHNINFIQNFGNKFVNSSIGFDVSAEQQSQLITHEEYYIKEIKWRVGKIAFVNSADRMDIEGTGLRLDRIDIFSGQPNSYSLRKKIKLSQSYFYSPPAGNSVATDKNYRLKLESVDNLNITDGTSEGLYQLTYNNTALPPRASFAQDRWGFNNGHLENTDLMPKGTQLFRGTYYNYGGAIKETVASEMLACTLSSIQYPTGGKTSFELEPHEFPLEIPATTELKTTRYSVCCGHGPSLQQSVTVTANKNNYRYKVFISGFDYPDVTDRPRIKVTDQSTGVIVVQESNSSNNISVDYSTGTNSISLIPGHTYIVEILLYTTNVNVSAYIDLSWEEEIPAATLTKQGGGLRIKSITNFNSDGAFISKVLYEYNNPVLLTAQYYQDINYEIVLHRSGNPSTDEGGSCYYSYEASLASSPNYSTIFYSNSVFPTSQYAGSPVLYKSVVEKAVNEAGIPNGKTVFNFDVSGDRATNGEVNPQVNGINTFYRPGPGVYLMNFNWKNGTETLREIYKSTSNNGFYKISQKITNYLQSESPQENVLKIRNKYIHQGCEVQNTEDFVLSFYPYMTGSKLPSSIVSTSWDDNGNSISSTQTFTYGLTKLLPSKIETVASDGKLKTTNLKYPRDFAVTGNVYAKMIERNIISPIVRTQVLLDETQTSLITINYKDWFENSNFLYPFNSELQVRANPSEVKILFNKFDSYGNIQEQQKPDDVKEVYLWSYNSSYPVAKIIGSDYETVSSVVSQLEIDNAVATGNDQTLRTLLDNLRTDMRTSKALVTTYTYKPLIGMTSETDPTGKSTFYEYDSFGRLKLMRDKDNNILKTFDYKYQQTAN